MGKFDSRVDKGVLVGYSSIRKEYVRDLTPHVGRIIYSYVIKVNINKS